MKYYKVFNPDMTCKGFKFEIGKTYEEEQAEICYSGFHFCENPLDCLNYYDLLDKDCNLINFAEVKPLDKIIKGNNEDTKRCTKKIKISAKLNLLGFIKASFDYISKTSKKNNKTSGYNSQVATSGYNSIIANIGRGGMAKGIKGTWITLAEYKDNKPYFVKSFQVDGVKIKENTFYTLKNKRLKEVKDND